MHFLILYDLVDDYLQKREPFRAAHIAHGRAAAQRGELVLGGALADSPAGGVLLFQGADARAAEAHAQADPYVKNGIVTGYRIRPWKSAIGTHAAARLPDDQPPSPATATRRGLAAFLRGSRYWVVASNSAGGPPQSAV